MAAKSVLHQSAAKVHKSAVCLIPPYYVTSAIQRIRCFRDKSFVRWPPHINLIYPFFEDVGGNFATAAQRAMEAVQHIKPFKVVLSSLNSFDHGNSSTLWLDATHSQELLELQSALASAFPACQDLNLDPNRSITHFVPHLSLGQWSKRSHLVEDMQELQASWQPIEWTVDEVVLISRKGFNDPFAMRYSVPLGTAAHAVGTSDATANTTITNSSSSSAGSSSSSRGVPAAPRLLNVPYVATVAAPNRLMAEAAAAEAEGGQRHRCFYGLGGATGGSWNFAYGANMNPAKLQGSRGLHPMKSCPARLPGYTLAFNHRGGFGNLMQVTQVAEAAGHGGVQKLGEVMSADMQTLLDGIQPPSHQQGQGQADDTAAAFDKQGCEVQATGHGGGGGSVAAAEAAAVASAGSSGITGGAGAPSEVHGVVHQLSPADLAALSNCEHEYWPCEVEVWPYATPAAALPPSIATATGASASTGSSTSQPLVAVAYITPPQRVIASGLPPPARYLKLVVEGAGHWQLDSQYVTWLTATEALPDGAQRGDQYYCSPEGEQLAAWPKVRTGRGGNAGGGRGRRHKQQKQH